jgi:hypothetical protein
MIKHNIRYNSQRNNINFDGTFPGSKQCFTTCSWCFMSFYTNKIDAKDDVGLSKYFDDLETTIGLPGIGEEMKQKDNSIVGKSSQYWEVQKYGITTYLNRNGIKGKAVCNYVGYYNMIKLLVDSGPVILGTNTLGGLSGGHIILAVGYDDKNLIVHDPYGNALTNYKDTNGEYVSYPDEYLKKFFVNNLLFWSNI